MGVVSDPKTAKRMAQALVMMVSSAMIKVPFTPHVPGCFVLARDLEREGIPMNFTHRRLPLQVSSCAA
jgi:transaldolase